MGTTRNPHLHPPSVGGGLSRRDFVTSMAVLAAGGLSRVSAQAPKKPQIRIRSLNHIGIRVSDMERSVAFYQRVFGMPVRYMEGAPEGKVAILALSSGPEFLALYPANGQKPSIFRLGLGVPNFDRKTLEPVLATHGLKGEWRTRKTGSGDAVELMVKDPDGLEIALQDPRYCAGAGALGSMCTAWTMPPAGNPPPLRLKTWNHLSYNVSSEEKALALYMGAMDLNIKTVDYRQRQPIRLLGILETQQTINPAEKEGAGRGGPLGGHFCFGVEGFDYDKVMKTLEPHKVNARVAQSGVRMGCCNSDVEYSFKETTSVPDPDGFGCQLTDVNFCGGRGPLGQFCPA
jgi:catechol 2,3-dioxygenase-like lactoylglutathione lyase family enzyme